LSIREAPKNRKAYWAGFLLTFFMVGTFLLVPAMGALLSATSHEATQSQSNGDNARDSTRKGTRPSAAKATADPKAEFAKLADRFDFTNPVDQKHPSQLTLVKSDGSLLASGNCGLTFDTLSGFNAGPQDLPAASAKKVKGTDHGTITLQGGQTFTVYPGQPIIFEAYPGSIYMFSKKFVQAWSIRTSDWFANVTQLPAEHHPDCNLPKS